MSTLRGIIRYYVAVAWSLVKVVAVTGIIGVGLILGVYFSPLELSGPKIAIAALVFGLMGAATVRPVLSGTSGTAKRCGNTP